MRIGVVVPGFSADLGDWCIPALRHLVVALSDRAEVHVFALRYPGQRGRYDLFGAEVTALDGAEARRLRSADLWRRAATAIAAEHRRRPFHVLHAFWAGEPGFVTALVGRALRIPTVVSIAGGELARLRDIGYGGLLRPLEALRTRLALRLANALTAGSAAALASAQRFDSHAKGRAWRVPLGVDLEMFAPGQDQGARLPTRILHVASLCRVKDQATLLSAAAALRDRGCDFRLDIVGTGPLETGLRALADALGISEHIRWRGAISHDRLPREYRRAQLFVLSSRHEAQGMVALEAAASGLPVVGTAVGVIPELAPDAARLARVADANGLADRMAEFLENAPSRVRAGCSARRRAEAEYGLDLSTTRFLDLYQDVSARSGGERA